MKEELRGNKAKIQHFKITNYNMKLRLIYDKIFQIRIHNDEEDTMLCSVGNIKMTLKVDSGSDVCTITPEHWDQMRLHGKFFRVENSSKAKSYASDEALPILAKFKAKLSIHPDLPSTMEEFYVVKKAKYGLMSKHAAKRLNILKIGLRLDAVNVTDDEEFPKVPDVVVSFDIDPSVPPHRAGYYRIPYALEDRAAKKLGKLERMKIIEKVEQSDHVNGLIAIPKGNDNIRLILDMRKNNKRIRQIDYPMPTFEDFTARLHGAQVFSKLDLKEAYHHFELDDKSRELTTFMTRDGLKRYTRLMFGVNCAPAIFQKFMDQKFAGIAGVKCFMDDILVFGTTQEQHDIALNITQQKLDSCNFKRNDKKCEFSKNSLEFLGHTISSVGIKAAAEKTDALRSFRRPETLAELQSFLGLLNYVSKFVKDCSTATDKLRQMIKQQKIEWTTERVAAFENIKTSLLYIKTLGYYDVKAKTRLFTDASPTGLGAILVQVQDGQEVVIAHAGKSLNETEKKYPQTQREALAAVWGVERFYFYLFGKFFTLVSDYRALKFIFGNEIPTNKRACSRAESWALRLQPYQFDVEYIKGEKNIADSFSRLAVDQFEVFKDEYDMFIDEISITDTPSSQEFDFLSKSEMISASKSDEEMSQLREAIDSGVWDKIECRVLRAMKHEFSHDGQLVYKDYQVVLPKALRKRALKLAHIAHAGIVVTKRILRKAVWWPKMTADIEKMVKCCAVCQLVSQKPRPEPLIMKQLPEKPWQSIAIDHFEIPDKTTILVIIDYYSRYLIVRNVKDETTATTIKHLEEVFNTWYYPEVLRCDNATTFESKEFQEYCAGRAIELVHSPPLNPESNGEVERQNEGILKCLRIAELEGTPYKVALQNHVRTYNMTDHSVLNLPPFEMLTKMKPRFLLETVKESTFTIEEAKERNKIEKLKSKEYADKRRRAKKSEIQVGDTVIVWNTKPGSKIKPRYINKQFEVISVDAKSKSAVIQHEDGSSYRRAFNHLKKWNSPDEEESSDTEENVIDTQIEESIFNEMIPSTSSLSSPPSSDQSGTRGSARPKSSSLQTKRKKKSTPRDSTSPPRKSSRTVKPPKRLIQICKVSKDTE